MRIHLEYKYEIYHTYSKNWVNSDWVIPFLAIFGDVFKANCVSRLLSVCFLCWPVLWMPEDKVEEREVSTKFYNFLAKKISRKSDYFGRFYSTLLVNTNMANISANINFKLVGRKSLLSRGGNKFLFCPTTKNFKPIGVFLTILEALSCKTKYRKYLAKYPFPGIHICLTYFQYCNNEPDIPKSSIKQLWNLDPRYTSISPRSAIESYMDQMFRELWSQFWVDVRRGEYADQG